MVDKANGYSLNSKQFETMLRGKFYARYRKASSANAYQDALNVLYCKAIYDGPEHATHIRVAGDATRIWIDRGAPEWDAIEITADGWSLICTCKSHFRQIEPLSLLINLFSLKYQYFLGFNQAIQLPRKR